MRHLVPFFLLAAFFGVSCSSAGNGIGAGNSSVSPTYVPDQVRNVNANVAVNTNQNRTVVANDQPKTGELRESTLAATAAPDDSTFTSSMDTDGNFMEIREFRSHPTILRVERKLIGREERFTVFLRNGKSVLAPAEKMQNLRSLAPENILNAIGQGDSKQRGTPTAPAVKKQP